jgi:hypothetical protein
VDLSGLCVHVDAEGMPTSTRRLDLEVPDQAELARGERVVEQLGRDRPPGEPAGSEVLGPGSAARGARGPRHVARQTEAARCVGEGLMGGQARSHGWSRLPPHEPVVGAHDAPVGAHVDLEVAIPHLDAPDPLSQHQVRDPAPLAAIVIGDDELREVVRSDVDGFGTCAKPGERDLEGVARGSAAPAHRLPGGRGGQQRPCEREGAPAHEAPPHPDRVAVHPPSDRRRVSAARDGSGPSRPTRILHWESGPRPREESRKRRRRAQRGVAERSCGACGLRPQADPHFGRLTRVSGQPPRAARARV